MSHKYLIDANVLATRTMREYIESDFFRDNCIILEEVAHELLDTSLFNTMNKMAEPINGSVLSYLSTIVDEMVKLGILKTDEGNGEALIIAWGLMLLDGPPGNQSVLEFAKEYPVVVTNEIKVMMFAKTKKLDSINGKTFIKLLRSSLTNEVSQ